MTLSEKLIRLRKKSGWSQEEFAEKLDVSRQAVSKWESGQSLPELDKILQISALYGVTTDYLLKDEIGEETAALVPETAPKAAAPETAAAHRVTLSEAEEILAAQKAAASRIAIGVFLCIIAVTPLLLFSGASVSYGTPSQNVAVVLGLPLLFAFVAAAVGLFVYAGFKLSRFSFLENGAFETDPDALPFVEERQKAYQSTYMRCNIIGACLCVLSPIPLLAGTFGVLSGDGLFSMLALSGTLLIVAAGVFCFVTAGVRWSGMKSLLKGEGARSENAPKSKSEKYMEAVSSAYWMIVTAVYLTWSFWSGGWGRTWIIWPIAGVVFAAIRAIADIFAVRRDQ